MTEIDNQTTFKPTGHRLPSEPSIETLVDGSDRLNDVTKTIGGFEKQKPRNRPKLSPYSKAYFDYLKTSGPRPIRMDQ
jgi:hypothetical protein